MSVRSAYVHVPFCRHRCGYCNFTVIADRDDLVENYLSAVNTEMGWLQGPHPVDTLFFGGGTPTHLPPETLARFLTDVQRAFVPTENAEISVEANPEDITPQLVDVLRAANVNRISLGVQSFKDEKLKTLERGHTADDIARCIEMLRPAIRSLSIDLIFGAPNETLEQWEADLNTALSFHPNHISTYGLTYEAGTQFFVRREKSELQQLPEDLEREMYEVAIDTVTAAGIEHYEVSNFASPGHRCRHNENYWRCGSFFGVGPGASAFVNGARTSNHRSTTTWLKMVEKGQSPIDESEKLGKQEFAHEFLVFGLRMLEGVRLQAFRAATGCDVDELVGEPLGWLCSEGLLDRDADVIRLTRKGLMVSDSIWPHLL